MDYNSAFYQNSISQLAKHHNQMASPKVAIVVHNLCALNIVPSKGFELRPILPELTKLDGFLHQTH